MGGNNETYHSLTLYSISAIMFLHMTEWTGYSIKKGGGDKYMLRV